MQVITTNKNISTKEFLNYVEEIKNNILDIYDDRKSSDLEVIQVWYCKTIQNHKGLFIVNDLITNKLYPYFYYQLLSLLYLFFFFFLLSY